MTSDFFTEERPVATCCVMACQHFCLQNVFHFNRKSWTFFFGGKKSRHNVFKKYSPLHSASAFFKTLFLNKIPVSRISMTSAVVPTKIYPLFMVDVLQFPHRCYFCENSPGKRNESFNSYATRSRPFWICQIFVLN